MRRWQNSVGLLLLAMVASAFGQSEAVSPSAQTPKELAEFAGWKGKVPNSDDSFNFVIISDRTGGHKPGEWERAIREINLLRPDFVMSVGDLIEGYTEDLDVLHEQWEEFDSIVRELQAPFFFVAGNHDVTNDVMWDLYLQRYGVNGRAYYSFNYRDCHFVILDSRAMIMVPENREEQLAWLAEDLSAAKDAKHIFLFYHHPVFDNDDVWKPLRAMLDPHRTTIYNGHIHRLSHGVEDDIPTMILSATGAGGNSNPLEGDLRMYCHVTVNDGQPTVAIVQLGNVYPQDLVDRRVMEASGLINSGAKMQYFPGEENWRVFAFSQRNRLDVPLEVSMQFSATGWTIEPAAPVEPVVLRPGEGKEWQWTMRPGSARTTRPVFKLGYEAVTSSGRAISINRDMELPEMMDISRKEGLKVDGSLDDWTGEAGLAVDSRARVMDGAAAWGGPEDCSYTVRLGHDGETLYVAVDVRDDQLRTGEQVAHHNDSVELFWDVRPWEMQSGRHGVGTGQIIVGLPVEGQKPEPVLYLSHDHKPENIAVATRRKESGYAMELSIPLAELGLEGEPQPGQTIRLEVQVNDRDIIGGEMVLKRLTTSGGDDNSRRTSRYMVCTFQ